MTKDIAYLRELSAQIDDLYDYGKEDEGHKLLERAIKESKSISEAYHLFFQGELLTYSDEFDRALPHYEKAVLLLKDDFWLLRNYGIILSKLGRDEEAIIKFDKALAINDKDYDAYMQKGVSLSYLGREEEAIIEYDKALALNPRDYFAYLNKGITLSKLGKDKKAAQCYDKAVELNSGNIEDLCNMAFASRYDSNTEQCIKLFRIAEKIDLDEKLYRAHKIQNYREYLSAFYPELADGKIDSISRSYTYLSGMIDKIRGRKKKTWQEFLNKMKDSEKARTGFIKDDSGIDATKSILMTLRKWNSYTPIVPGDNDDRYVGGGYFLIHNGIGTVIDPGYNFIENFYRAGGKISDIRNIVISHAHNDHTIDFESILSLIYKRFSLLKKEPEKLQPVNIYLNPGSMVKFSGLLDLRNADYIGKICMLTPGIRYDLGQGVTLTGLPAYHDEVISTRFCVGFKFEINYPEAKDGKQKKQEKQQRLLAFTADTGLFPRKASGSEKVDTNQPEICSLYDLGETQPDLLVPHIGSIKEQEVDDKKEPWKENCFYPNHLGIIGTIRVIQQLKPKLAVISEFGEELKQFRENLLDLICFIVADLLKTSTQETKILPGDIPFVYDIYARKVLCNATHKWIDPDKIKYDLQNSDTFYYYDKSIQKITTNHEKYDEFESLRKNRKKLYFKS